MAVAVVKEFEGTTLDLNDRVLELLGSKPGGSGAPGGLFHWVTTMDYGVRVAGAWEDQEQFERFAQQEIGPATQRAGVPGAPRKNFFDVHNILTAG